MSRVVLRLPAALRDETEGVRELELDARDLADALDELIGRFPSLRRHLFADAGGLRRHVNVFVNQDEARGRGGIDAPLDDGDVVTIVPSIAGGAGDVAAEPPAAPDATSSLSDSELARYSRHLALREVGREGQERLKAGRVLIVGAGGLGSPAALYLAAAGVGTVGLVEFDRLDVTNLQRQVLYGERDIGRPKLDAAVERLRDLNPNVDVVRHDLRLDGGNALDVLRGYDVVVDGSDNFPTRYLVNDACVLLGVPYVYGAILRFEGQVSVFATGDGPCYRCLFRQPPPPGLVPNCAEAGVIGALPGVIGAMQAMEAVKLLTGAGDSLAGRLLIFDALAARWRELTLRRDPECPVCGDHPTIHELIDYEEFCGLTTTREQGRPNEAPEISATDLARRLENDDVMLLDIREPHELDIANLADRGAVAIPMGDLPDRLDELDRDRDIVVFCHSGSRSAAVTRYLRSAGFDRVHSLTGGIVAWSDEVDPSVRKY